MPMFQDHRTSGFWRRRFIKVFTIYGRGGHLGHVTWIIYINFRSPFPRRLHIKFGFGLAKRFQRRRRLKMVDDDNDYNDDDDKDHNDDVCQSMGIL